MHDSLLYLLFFQQLIYASYNPSVASQQLPLHNGAFDIVTLEFRSLLLTFLGFSGILLLVVDVSDVPDRSTFFIGETEDEHCLFRKP